MTKLRYVGNAPRRIEANLASFTTIASRQRCAAAPYSEWKHYPRLIIRAFGKHSISAVRRDRDVSNLSSRYTRAFYIIISIVRVKYAEIRHVLIN